MELRFRISDSQLLSDDEKQLLRNKYPNKINDDDEFILVCQTERSQLKNKEKVIEKFYKLLLIALTPKVKRKPTKRTKASVARRLDEKKKVSAKKAVRKFKDEGSE